MSSRGKNLWDEIKNAESYYSDNYNALHNGLTLLNYSYLHVLKNTIFPQIAIIKLKFPLRSSSQSCTNVTYKPTYLQKSRLSNTYAAASIIYGSMPAGRLCPTAQNYNIISILKKVIINIQKTVGRSGYLGRYFSLIIILFFTSHFYLKVFTLLW